MWIANPGWWGSPNRAALDATAGGGATTTWDPANKFQITLSGGNLAATNSVGPGQFGVVRGISSYSTGKFYCEFTISGTAASTCDFGICNASQSVTSGVILGSSANSYGLQCTNGDLRWNNTSPHNIDPGIFPIGAGTVIGMAVDVGAKLGWWRVNALLWNNNASGNPSTGTNGFDISGVTGTLFLMGDVESNVATLTLNAGGSAYAHFDSTVTGFGNW